MRLPPQGGLPPVGAVSGAVLEIACDESGFSGTNLLDPVTPVITHASVDLRAEEAAAVIAELRDGYWLTRSELKSGRWLRGPRVGEAVDWLLAALRGRAHVQLVDKEFFLVTRIVDLLLAEPSYAAGTRLTQQHRPAALALYRAGRAVRTDWNAFLAAFVELVRVKRRQRPDRDSLERFFRARDSLVRQGLGAQAEGVLAGLSRTRVRAFLTRLSEDDRSIPPPLEPMLPALAETVLHWSGGQRQVLVIHDEQSALTADRLGRLQRVLAEAGPAPAGSPLVGLVMVDSRDDPRVQVADLLAGVARRAPGTAGPLLSPTSLRDPGPGVGSPSMALTFEHDRDAFLAVLALVVGGDRQGSLRERDYLLQEVRPLPVFGEMDTAEFSKLLGEVTERVYTSLPQQDGVFSTDGVEEMLVAARTALGPELCETAVRSAESLCASDGSADGEQALLVQIRRVLG